MSVPFNAKRGPILIEAEVTGPARSMTLELILLRNHLLTIDFQAGQISLA